MTDGIYDPKFIVEAEFGKNRMLERFLEDLQGKNDERVNVNFDKEILR